MMISLLLIIFSPYTAFLPLIYISYRILAKKEAINRNPWNLGLLILFVWSLISGILNRSLTSTVLSVAFFMYFCLSVYLENRYNSEDKIEKLLQYIVYFSIVTALLGIFEKIYFIFYDNSLWKRILRITYDNKIPHRIYSTFGNPNVAGTWFAAMTLVSIYFCCRTSGKRKLFYQVSSTLFFTALLLTGSRGADIGLLAGLFAYYSLRKNIKNFKYLVIIFVLLAAVVLLPSQILYSKNLMGHELNTSFSSRNAIWDGCVKMMFLKPVTGWGLMGIYDHGLDFMNYHSKVFHGHNTWITLAASLGFVGLSVYVFMKFYLYAGLKTLYNNECTIAPLLAAIQVLILCHGFVDFTIMTPQAGLLFVVSSSFISSLAQRYSQSPARSTIPSLTQISLANLISAFINQPIMPALFNFAENAKLPILSDLAQKAGNPKVYNIIDKSALHAINTLSSKHIRAMSGLPAASVAKYSPLSKIG